MAALDLRLDLPQGLALGAEPVLAPLSLTLRGGAWTVLLGPSGVGKSTLLRAIAGLLPGVPGLGPAAMMPQQDLLVPWRDALANVTLGAHLRGQPPDLDRARALLAEVGLDPADHRKRPAQLSGGMRQRVALARTLMEDRPLVLLDEPFSAVDAPTRHRLQTLAARLLAGRTVLLVTHDPLEALRLADQMFLLAGSPAAPVPLSVPDGLAPRDPAALGAAQAALLERLAA